MSFRGLCARQPDVPGSGALDGRLNEESQGRSVQTVHAGLGQWRDMGAVHDRAHLRDAALPVSEGALRNHSRWVCSRIATHGGSAQAGSRERRLTCACSRRPASDMRGIFEYWRVAGRG
jgi:hypothetical protein